MDPLKLYEYLTMGLPIVSTPVPPTEEFDPLVYVADRAEFSSRIGEALGEPERPEAEKLWKARIDEAKKHRWENRVEKILEYIRSVFQDSSRQ